MLRKILPFFILVFFLLKVGCWGFPAKDVQVITDRQYVEAVRRCLMNAKSSVKMMMFEASYYSTYPNSPSNLLIRELITAKKRGVDVKVILEQREGSERATLSNRETGALLARSGVDVVYDPLTVTTHTKLLIIDGEISILGSTNWTYHALDKNHEVAVVIRSPEVADDLQNYFQNVWKTSRSK